jgi:hypothetical protein
MISFPIAWLNFILHFIFEVGNTFALFQITIFHFLVSTIEEHEYANESSCFSNW